MPIQVFACIIHKKKRKKGKKIESRKKGGREA